MTEQKNNDNGNKKNWQLEYEQIIASLHNIEIVEVAVAVFIIPAISWGLTLKSSKGVSFCIQEIELVGRISIIIWFIYIGCYIAIHFRKVKKLLERARHIYKDDNEDQNTHISILSSPNIFNYSIFFKLIGFIICIIWIIKYKLVLTFIICLLLTAIIAIYCYIYKIKKGRTNK